MFKPVPEKVRARGASFPFSDEDRLKVRAKSLQSLANIRVLYRQQVDSYLLDTIDSSGTLR